MCSPSPLLYDHDFAHESRAINLLERFSTKAERQKARSEQQAAAQTSSKRSRIDFAKEALPGRPAREKDTGRKGRFEPYGSGHPYADGKSKGYSKDRQKSRWG